MVTVDENNSNFARKRFFLKLKPVEQEFDDIQQGAKVAIERIQGRFVSSEARTLWTPEWTLGSNWVVNVNANAALDINGRSTDWDAPVAVDCSSATHATANTSTGDTTPGAGKRKFIVIAAAHTEVDADPVTTIYGVKYYSINSTTVLRVYCSTADFDPVMDDWFSSAAMATIFDEIVDDGAVPVLVCHRDDGDSAFGSDDIWAVEREICTNEPDFAQELELLRRIVGHRMKPIVLNETGIVAGTPSAVGGSGGRLTLPGGEEIVLGIGDLGPSGDSEKYRRRGFRKVTVPASVIDFPLATTAYVVRMAYPASGADPTVSVHAVTCTPPDPLFPLEAWTAFKTLPGGSAGGGFESSVRDVALFYVITGSLGTLPTVFPLSTNPDPIGPRIIARGKAETDGIGGVTLDPEASQGVDSVSLVGAQFKIVLLPTIIGEPLPFGYAEDSGGALFLGGSAGWSGIGGNDVSMQFWDATMGVQYGIDSNAVDITFHIIGSTTHETW